MTRAARRAGLKGSVIWCR